MPPEACSKSITFPNPSLTKLAGESVYHLWISVEGTAQSPETQKTSTFRLKQTALRPKGIPRSQNSTSLTI